MSAELQTDEQLMQSLAAGGTSALGVLAERYQNDLFRFCLHYLRDIERARDMVQETFIRVFVARSRFDARRAFKPWALCIARNLCLNELKRRKLAPMESLDEYAAAARASDEALRDPNESPAQRACAAERYAMLADALQELDPESRELMVLRFFERMSAKEIADIIGSTEGAVRTRVHRILKSLRTRYESARDII